jgi:hypothetical protein
MPVIAGSAPQASHPATFNRLNRSVTPTVPIQPLPATPFIPRAPAPLARQSVMPMRDATLPLDPIAGGHFMSNDQRLEITIPGSAVNGADVLAAGGQVRLSLRQIAPASGSSAGGSGHVSLGTFLIQVTDAQGRLVGHGTASPAIPPKEASTSSQLWSKRRRWSSADGRSG